jgi:hypothetical protein
MKVNRKELEWFLSNIRRKNDGKELTDAELINQLANWMEVNPACINMDEASHSGRFSYHTVGYGVFSLLGERYRMGRVEIFDKEDESGYTTAEGSYCMPFIAANQFEDFIETLRTDLPINIEIGSHEWCVMECERDLGIEKGMLHDAETKKAYYRKKNDEYAVERGYKDWDDLTAHSIFAPKKKEDEI